MELLKWIGCTTYLADFKLLSNQLQRHRKITPIYDFFKLDDTSFSQKYFFICTLYESSSRNVLIFVARVNGKH